MKKSIVRISVVLLTLIMMLVCFTACSVAVENIVLSNTEIKINVGSTQAVSCTIVPEDATDKTVTWESSNTAVATVNNMGVISAIGAGTCTITAKCGEAEASLTVTVAKPVEQVVLNKTDVTIKEEETFSFTCTIVPNDASNKNVTWQSSDSSIATVDANGTIIGIKAGTCTITASAEGKSATANITIKEKGPDLKAIYNELCNSIWADIASDGSYLSVDTNPYDYDDGDYRYTFTVSDAIEKIHEKMGLPESLYEDMNHTSALMGKQHETFENVGVTVSWTYHPDNGLEVTYKLINN